ncbi:MAG TPA: S8 family serine peptidase [Acidimicrobiia bacterium]|jgi:type VII secretion-associated serine protease mycosin|nr:S8 family serine peptidase [Acidimicrobiia bacterium]
MAREGRAIRGRRWLVAGAVALTASLPTGAHALTGGSGVAAGPAVSMYAVVTDGSNVKVEHFTAANAAAAQSIQADTASAGNEIVGVDSPVHSLDLGDPYRASQWALPDVGFPDAWPLTQGAGVTVAVVDSGVLGTHEDLAGSVLSGADFVSPGNGWNDRLGHGTFVAGLIAAHVGNGRGIAGAAPNVKILPVRVLDSGGSGTSANVAAGIVYAANHGAHVINLSLGGTGADPGERAAVDYAISKGAVVVAAAGNSGQTGSPAIYPAAFPEVLAVGAVDSHNAHAAFSNVGSYVDVVAPGVNVLSTYNGSTHSYAQGEGTSFAAPYASAAVALVEASNPKLDPVGVTSFVEGTAIDLGPRGRDAWYGAGLVSTRLLVHATAAADEGSGYWVVTANGAVHAFGGAHDYGDVAGRVSGAIVASARTPSGHGYWLASADGSVYAFGDARYAGSMNGRHLNSAIVGMASTPTGNGYYLLGRDGGIFTFGDAHFYGSTGAIHLNAPVLDMTATADGHGYWMVAGDGGIFTFGDASFHGSTGAMHLNSPAMSMTAADSGGGYWIVARDGGIFTFGVPFAGSVPNLGISGVDGVRIRAMPSGRGYLVLSGGGGVYSFGTARFFGSASASAYAPAVDLMTLGS